LFFGPNNGQCNIFLPECESSYIKHENEGGITIAHQENTESDVKDESSSEIKTESAPAGASLF